jgi:predicted transcriptional regulator
MSKFEKSAPDLEQDEDAATLAAIDEGIRDAEVGRTVPAEKVREILASLIANNRRK